MNLERVRNTPAKPKKYFVSILRIPPGVIAADMASFFIDCGIVLTSKVRLSKFGGTFVG